MQPHVAHPPGAARREHGKHRAGIALAQAVQELAAFLHDGHVRREVGVEHVVEAQRAQRGGQAPLAGVGAFEPEPFAPRGAHRRGHLGHAHRVEVGQGSQHRIGVVALAQGAGRAMGNALAAQRAAGILDGQAVAHVHVEPRGAVLDVPHIAALHLGAHLHAAQAAHALRAIADEGEARIPALVRRVLGVRHVQHVELARQRLQHAIAVAHAGRALHLVL